MHILGVVLAAFGAALAIRSAVLLAGRGRPQRGAQPPFVIAGPYRRFRNPLYAGIVLALAGIGLARGSILLAVLALVAAAGAHAWVVRVEEPRLSERFGAAYAAYLRKVPRWVPGRSTGAGS